MSIAVFRDRLATDIATIDEINEVEKFSKPISDGYPISTISYENSPPDEALDQDRWEREFTYIIRIFDEMNVDQATASDRMDNLLDLVLAKIDSEDYTSIGGYLKRQDGMGKEEDKKADGWVYTGTIRVTIQEVVTHL